MPPKRIRLKANNIDGAAEQLIHLLEGTNKGGDVIYFHGWYGWGASAVLKEVVRRLRSSLGSANTAIPGGFEKIIHVDFSQWQSKRALQKAITKELELPQQVMALFDQRDEEDDFDGVEQSARGVIPHVKLAIMNELIAHRYLVVLHNGSGSFIEIQEFGVPLIGELSKSVLWTSQGRFWPHVPSRHENDEVESAGLSDCVICGYVSSDEEDVSSDEEDVSFDEEDDWRHILYAEAEEIAKYTGVPEPDMSPKIVTECILYMAARGDDQGISWETHASNYWVCDGIIHDATDGGRSAWEISDALQRNMNLNLCNECAQGIYKFWRGEHQRHIDCWVSATSQNSKEVQVPPQATSFFWTVGGPSSSTGHKGTSILKAAMFKRLDRTVGLRVIHLSHCTFSFSSPPFLGCGNLRFLLLDHCKDQDTQELDEETERHHHNHCIQQDGGSFFQNLWVLEVSYTDWYWLLSKDMLNLMVDLRELNVKGVGTRSMMHLHRCSGAKSNKLIKLRVVADDSNQALDHDDGTCGVRNEQLCLEAASSFPDLTSWYILKAVVLDGCGDLEQIDYNTLPLSLESFTLIGSVHSKIKSISFRGCTKLKSFLLGGSLDSLVELDMSGTAVKILDLSANIARGLRRLILLGCEELRAILWPQERFMKIWLDVLCVDTAAPVTAATHAAWDRERGKSNQQQEATTSDNASIGSSSTTICGEGRTIVDSDSYISIRDPRFFRPLMDLRHSKKLHVGISSTSGHKGVANQGIYSSACGQQKPAGNLYYADDITLTFSSNSQDDGANRDRFEVEASTMKSMWLWHCPPIPRDSDWAHCYISIQDDTETPTSTQLTSGITLPNFVHRNAMTLHLHDSLSITCLPGPAPFTTRRVDLQWEDLRWCRLERCPNIEGVVFTTPEKKYDYPIFYHLETFWASQLPKTCYIWDWSEFRPGKFSFKHLVFLHLDYCPRLVHVLPLYASNANGCHSLETLEIVCCGDLREVFPSDLELQQQKEAREFPSLKRIHLFELPKLQHICGHRMLAPNLETVKIKGCWSLKRLPALGDEAESSEKESSDDITPLSSVVELDCEKEWWDSLEWDGKKAGHSPSHYKLTYSAYYKKNQLRASVLR